MAFTIPSLSETRDFLRAVGKAVFPDRNFGNLKSYHSRRATFLAAAVTQLHAQIDSVEDDVMVDTAGDNGPIDRWGAIVGVARKGATPARKSAAGRVRGTVATAVSAGAELVHEPSGLRFKIATGGIIGAGGYLDVDIVAIDLGARTRLDKGQTLKFLVTPPGLKTPIALVKPIDEDGYDSEPFGAYRDRVLAAFSEPTAGGTQSDYVEWMLEVPGVSNAYAYPNRAGLGTVDLVALHSGTGSARELSGGERAEVVGYVAERAPATVTDAALRHLDIQIQEEDVELVLTPNGEATYAKDWDDSVPLEVATWDAGTLTLTFGADRPDSMKAGHRLVIEGVATAQTGKEVTIAALGVSADSVVLEGAPEVDPAATDIVYSGGPLVTPIRDAIVAHMDGETVYAGRNRVPLRESAVTSTVGLEVLTRGIGPANPGGAYGSWNGDLLRSLLFQLAMYKAGTRNVDIVTPATDVAAVDYALPDDDKISLIAPGSVIVRYV